MNSKKYKDTIYETRDINNIKELFVGSCDLYAHKTAYLVKEKPGGKYMPIKYSRVKEDVECLGTGFYKLGLRGEKIAVLGENSYEWVMTYIATVIGSSVIVPIDKELPANEVANLLTRAKVSAVVYSKKSEKLLHAALEQMEEETANGIKYRICMKSDHGAAETDLDTVMEIGRTALISGDRSFLDNEVDGDAMCTLMFTSGTTGMAKGVMLSQRNIAANVQNMSKYVKIDDDGIGLSVLPMNHSYEMTCHIFTGFYQGMAIAICEGLKYIQKNLVESKATVMLGVPLIFENIYKKIMKQASSKGKAKKMRKMMERSKKYRLYNDQNFIRKIFKSVHEPLGNSIRLLIVGGAAMNPKIIEDFQALGFPMIQGYGMSENAPIIAVNRDKCSKPASVGPAMPGTEIRIDSPNEDGIGEIVVKGPSVMLGYYENPEATAEAIRDGWLYTGDYGYFDDEGYLYISGRKKNVIVTKNGKNIFPEEIEYILSEADFIAEVLVYGEIDEKTGDTFVKAEIYPDYGQIKEEFGKLTDEEVEKLIKHVVSEVCDVLPTYKRVTRVAVRDVEFEKTTTRKVKRNQKKLEKNAKNQDK